MKVRFQADADLDVRIVRGLKRRLPSIDFPVASVGVAIEELLLIWEASDLEEWRDRLVWVPL